jgi:hypothetical protein
VVVVDRPDNAAGCAQGYPTNIEPSLDGEQMFVGKRDEPVAAQGVQKGDVRKARH